MFLLKVRVPARRWLPSSPPSQVHLACSAHSAEASMKVGILMMLVAHSAELELAIFSPFSYRCLQCPPGLLIHCLAQGSIFAVYLWEDARECCSCLVSMVMIPADSKAFVDWRICLVVTQHFPAAVNLDGRDRRISVYGNYFLNSPLTAYWSTISHTAWYVEFSGTWTWTPRRQGDQSVSLMSTMKATK